MTSRVEVGICEAILIQMKEYYVRHNVFYDYIPIIENFLDRKEEMINVYCEICKKLGNSNSEIESFFNICLAVAADFNLEKLKTARDDRRSLRTINENIRDKARELSLLIKNRTTLEYNSAFSCGTENNSIDILIESSEGNPLFRSFLKDNLAKLRSQFDSKYWPTAEIFVQMISRDAEKAIVQANDIVTEASTSRKRPSLADCLRALLTAIDENLENNSGPLPAEFKVSDAAIASIMNCAFSLEPETVVDAAWVKRTRQRDRQTATPVQY